MLLPKGERFAVLHPHVNLRQAVNDLREQHSHHPSLEGQIKVLAAHHWRGTVPGESGPDLGKRDMDLTLEAMGLELDCKLDTAVRNLADADLLGSYEPNGPDWYLIRDRDEEFVLGDKFPPAVREECSRAIEHLRSMDPPEEEEEPPKAADGGELVETNKDGQTLREEVAETLDRNADNLEDWLRAGDARTRREKLEQFVEAIENSETFAVPDSFDKIRLLPKGYRYHRSSQALRRY